MSPRILVFASINIDLTARVDRLPRPGETLLTGSATACPGGKGANQAVAAKRLGADVGMVCCVGDDLQGEALRKAMGDEGIDLVGWHVDPQRPTGAALINVLPDGQNAIVVASGANQSLSPQHVDAAFDQDNTWDFSLVTMETPLETVKRIHEVAGRLDIPLLLDAGGHPELLHDDRGFFSDVSILTANETESSVLTGRQVTDSESAERAAAEIAPWTVLVKLGAQGTLLRGNGVMLHEPAFNVDVIDTVAAGDAHSAAFAVGWAERAQSDPTSEEAARRVLRFANAAGALTCTEPGAIPSLPTRADVEALLR
jgi:ribokinase